jgi:hypothetical protein
VIKVARSERVEAGGTWQADLETRLLAELDRHGYSTPDDRRALAAALAVAIAEPIDRHLDEIYSQWADLTAGRAKELLRRSLQGSFRRELKHIIRETLEEQASDVPTDSGPDQA